MVEGKLFEGGCPFCDVDDLAFSVTRSHNEIICPNCGADFFVFLGALKSCESNQDDANDYSKMQFKLVLYDFDGKLEVFKFVTSNTMQFDINDQLMLIFTSEEEVSMVINYSKDKTFTV